MMVELYEHQIDAVSKLKNGSILCGGVGSGKSRTALAYYFFKVCKGDAPVNGNGEWHYMENPMNLYIITTAKKRDSLEWESECAIFNLSEDIDDSMNGVQVIIDSWNNIKKYINVYGAFFIFDEQRVVGKGVWVKSFLRIAKRNKWILLSATPGDTWSDYIPVFIANGFYRTRSEFNERHCVFNAFTKWRQIERYIFVGELIRQRDDITVNMPIERHTVPNHFDVIVDYDKTLYSTVMKARWNPYEDIPIDEPGKVCYLLRRIVNDSDERIEALRGILKEHKKAIVFYNFNYELERLREFLTKEEVLYSEWNGQKHETVPEGDAWVYLVQYSAGAEGWNCITTDTIIFYSLNYSYRVTAQAEGRIDRLNTPYVDLYYYHIQTKSPIDKAIKMSLKRKKNFNERKFIGF